MPHNGTVSIHAASLLLVKKEKEIRKMIKRGDIVGDSQGVRTDGAGKIRMRSELQEMYDRMEKSKRETVEVEVEYNDNA